MNNKKYHRKIKNKLNKDWTNQDNQTKVELAYMSHYMGFSSPQQSQERGEGTVNYMVSMVSQD